MNSQVAILHLRVLGDFGEDESDSHLLPRLDAPVRVLDGGKPDIPKNVRERWGCGCQNRFGIPFWGR